MTISNWPVAGATLNLRKFYYHLKAGKPVYCTQGLEIGFDFAYLTKEDETHIAVGRSGPEGFRRACYLRLLPHKTFRLFGDLLEITVPRVSFVTYNLNGKTVIV